MSTPTVKWFWKNLSTSVCDFCGKEHICLPIQSTHTIPNTYEEPVWSAEICKHCARRIASGIQSKEAAVIDKEDNAKKFDDVEEEDE